MLGVAEKIEKLLAVARTDHEQTNLKRQIDATDCRIDRLVYDLYDLTDEEIRIVREGLTITLLILDD